MHDALFAGLAFVSYCFIAGYFWAISIKNNPHFLRPEWRLERVLLMIFCLVWPLTAPFAIIFWHRSPERRLLKAKRRRSSGERSQREAEKTEYRETGTTSRKTYVPHTRRNRK